MIPTCPHTRLSKVSRTVVSRHLKFYRLKYKTHKPYSLTRHTALQSTHTSRPVSRVCICIHTRFACAPHMGAHDPCRPGQCARTLQPAEQRRAFQLQLQAWLQTPPPRSSWEVAGEIEEIDEEIASVTSVEVRSGAARSTW